MRRRVTHAPFSIRLTFVTPVNQSGLGATMLTTSTSGCAGSTRTVATIESFQFLSAPDSNSASALPCLMASLISSLSGECLPSSDSRSRPRVGRRPTAKIGECAWCEAPIIPEKCASDGYSSGKFAFVHVLLMITVYSAGPVGAAGGAGRAAAGAGGGGGVLGPFLYAAD